VGRKIIALVLILAGLGLVGWGGYNFLKSRKPNAGLKVETNPPGLVFVDNVQIGQSPIEKIFHPGEVSLKIIPDSTASALTTYQTKVRLNPQTFTVVHRDFGPTEALTGGEIITLEPQSEKTASLSVVTSSPDSASVTIDGDPQGFSPVLVPSISPGDHEIMISSPGFTSRTVTAKTVAGYKLVINAKLAGEIIQITPSPIASPSATPSGTLKTTVTPKVSPTPSPRVTSRTTPSPTGVQSGNILVEIKQTPVGFLRVRSGPSTGSTEIGRVDPGERFRLLQEKSGWYQIEVDLDATSSGWISGQYATKLD
jgi:hypothetical protein